MTRKHGILPDTQAKPHVHLQHMKWAGDYFAEKKPDVIVHVGDHYDMPSLSHWDKGTMAAEGRAYEDDIAAGNLAMDLFMAPIRAEQRRQAQFLRRNRWKAMHGTDRRYVEALLDTGLSPAKPPAASLKPWLWVPRLVFTIGNHEQRIERHVSHNPELRKTLGYHSFNLERHGWEVYGFLQPVIIDGISYQHYVPNPNTGRPWGGMAEPRLSKIGFSFVSGHEQGKKSGERYLQNNTVQRALIVGCLAPEHRILMADLTYKPAGELQAGDKVVSFDEHPGTDGKRSRRYLTGTVRSVAREDLPSYRITLASGKSFVASSNHQWLRKTGTAYSWCLTTQLRKGTRLPRLFDEWQPATSFDAGWLAGMYDGEGCLYTRTTTGGQASQLSISQNAGPILAKLQRLLPVVLGARFGKDKSGGQSCYTLRPLGGQRVIAKILGTLRPEKMLRVFKPEILGRVACADSLCDTVVSVEFLGLREVVLTDVDHKTYVAEGYGHHNSYYLHDEDYKGAMGNHHWRGICMLHEVARGNFDLMEVSMSYLRKRYFEKRPNASKEPVRYVP